MQKHGWNCAQVTKIRQVWLTEADQAVMLYRKSKRVNSRS